MAKCTDEDEGNEGEVARTPSSIARQPAQRFIHSIPSVRYANSHHFAEASVSFAVSTDLDSREAEICSICLGDLEPEDQIKELLCAHCYHSECLDEWLRINVLCPLCKRRAAPWREEEVDREAGNFPSTSSSPPPSTPTRPFPSPATSLSRHVSPTSDMLVEMTPLNQDRYEDLSLDERGTSLAQNSDQSASNSHNSTTTISHILPFPGSTHNFHASQLGPPLGGNNSGRLSVELPSSSPSSDDDSEVGGWELDEGREITL